LYVAESTPSVTGSMADHRQRMLSRDVARAALSLAQAVTQQSTEPPDPFLSAAAHDLLDHPRTSLLIARDEQPPAVHALAHFINDRLGNAGRTVEYTDPVEAEPVDDMESLGALVADMDRGSVELLVVIGANPVFTAPRDQPFADRLSRVGLAVHLGL